LLERGGGKKIGEGGKGSVCDPMWRRVHRVEYEFRGSGEIEMRASRTVGFDEWGQAVSGKTSTA
jgi:hypothetical protein